MSRRARIIPAPRAVASVWGGERDDRGVWSMDGARRKRTRAGAPRALRAHRARSRPRTRRAVDRARARRGRVATVTGWGLPPRRLCPRSRALAARRRLRAGL